MASTDSVVRNVLEPYLPRVLANLVVDYRQPRVLISEWVGLERTVDTEEEEIEFMCDLIEIAWGKMGYHSDECWQCIDALPVVPRIVQKAWELAR